MSKQLSLDDFRAVRRILEPDDFALGGDEPDPPPSDLVDKKTWNGIVTLPDDVAIRTSDHNGRALGEVYWLWGRWIEATDMTNDQLFSPMLDAADDLQASMFDALHGYYRTGFSALRNVLELMTIGTYGVLNNGPRYENWRNGSEEFKFAEACNQLSREPSIQTFNTNMRSAGYQSLWDSKQTTLDGGYSRRLYRSLCNYAHSRPGYTDGDIRRSNGPIFVAKGFWDWYYAFLQTTSLCSILMFLARPQGDRCFLSDLFSDDPNVLPPDLLHAYKLV